MRSALRTPNNPPDPCTTHLRAERVGRALERMGLLQRDAESAWLDLPPVEDTDAMRQLLGSSVTYRIALGPQAGRKALVLRTITPLVGEDPSSERVAKAHGFSLHAGVSCEAHQRELRERLCRYDVQGCTSVAGGRMPGATIARPAVAEQRLRVNAQGKVVYLLKTPYRDGTGARGGYSHRVAFDGAFAKNPAATDFFGYRDADGDPFTVSQDFHTYYEAELTDLLARIEWRAGDITVTSVSNYQDIDHGYGEDADVSPNDIYNYEAANDVSQVSQEFRLAWDTDSMRNVIGAFYLRIDGNHDTRQTGDAYFGTGVGYPAGTAELTMTDQETETWAIFGQTDIDLAELWTLTLGGRVNRDSKDFDFFSTDIYFLQGGDFGYQDSFSDTDWSAKAQLNYRPTDGWLLYAGVSRGIKSGGFNQPLFPIAASDFPFKGETLVSFEVGMKADLTDTMRLNASAFYYDYSDYQAYSFDGFATFLFNANAESYGAEFEFIANPVEGLDIMLGLAWLDTEATDVPATISATGKETPPLSPDFSFNSLIRYEWPALSGTLNVQIDYGWQDDQNFNLIYTPVVEEKSYGVANLRVGYASPDATWSAAVWVKNLGDEDYRTYSFDTTAFFGSTEDVPGLERWFGGGVTYRW
jgi:iron complex outermembrane recepter protein